MKHRLFWAFSVPKPVAHSLVSLQASIEGFLLPEERIRFVRAEDMHITGQFLGEQEEEVIPGLLRVLERASEVSRPMSVIIDALDFFPKNGEPRALYARVAGESVGLLVRMRQTIGQAVSIIVTPAHTHLTWEPHITLGRNSGPMRRSVVEKISIPEIAFSVTEIGLYKSELHKEGPIYTCLGKFLFSQNT